MRYLALFCLCCSLTVSAQTVDSNRVDRLQFGVVGGAGWHQVDFTPNVSVERVEGRRYGVAVRYFDNKLAGVQAELSYVEAGWSQDLSDTLLTPYVRTSRYVEFTALTQISIGNGRVQPLLQAGPYVAFPLGDDEDIPAGYRAPETVLPPVIGRPLDSRLNYGLRAGGGLNLELGRLTIQLEGHYQAGFNNIIRSGETTATVSRRDAVGGAVALFAAFGSPAVR